MINFDTIYIHARGSFMDQSIFRLIFLLIVGICPSFAQTNFEVMEFNEGYFEILSTDKLPSSILAEIKAVQSDKKPKIQRIKDFSGLLKYYELSEEVKILGFDRKVRGPIKVSPLNIVYKKQEECTNYPDTFLKGTYVEKAKDLAGIALPTSAIVIEDEKEIKKLSVIVSVGIAKLLGKNFENQLLLVVNSSSYFRYKGEVYILSAGIGQGGYLGKIQEGMYKKVRDLQLPMCGA
jgi:hypothetical protein